MSSLLQVRAVPEDVRRALKARAAANGESLNSYLLRLLEREVAQPTVGEVLERAAQRAERAPRSAVEVIEEERRVREARLRRRADA